MNIGGTAFLTPCGNFLLQGFFYGSKGSEKGGRTVITGVLKIKIQVAE